MTKHIIAIDTDEIEVIEHDVPLSIEDTLRLIEAAEILDDAPDADDPFEYSVDPDVYLSYEQYILDAQPSWMELS